MSRKPTGCADDKEGPDRLQGLLVSTVCTRMQSDATVGRERNKQQSDSSEGGKEGD